MNEFKYKYNEDKCAEELLNHIRSTYDSHYASSSSDIQPNDLIISNGDGAGFFRGNAIKYLSRMDKKGTPKADLLKAMHYCFLLYNNNDYVTKNETV
ncbi:DUF3310 domain-containing protein [bacterium]|nr:DUF3310 domain-containing protein [bacterium]